MGTLIVGGIILAAVGLSVFSMVRQKREGGSCSCGCSECAYAEKCGK